LSNDLRATLLPKGGERSLEAFERARQLSLRNLSLPKAFGESLDIPQLLNDWLRSLIASFEGASGSLIRSAFRRSMMLSAIEIAV
jgi:hypothetical protein